MSAKPSRSSKSHQAVSSEIQRRLRDDKTYPYIKFTATEKFPRVYFTRRIKKTARSTSARISLRAWRAAFFTSCTNGS